MLNSLYITICNNILNKSTGAYTACLPGRHPSITDTSWPCDISDQHRCLILTILYPFSAFLIKLRQYTSHGIANDHHLEFKLILHEIKLMLLLDSPISNSPKFCDKICIFGQLNTTLHIPVFIYLGLLVHIILLIEYFNDLNMPNYIEINDMVSEREILSH